MSHSAPLPECYTFAWQSITCVKPLCPLCLCGSIKINMSTHTLTLRNNRFTYRLAGEGECTIVLVHGHNRDGDDFAALIDDLSRDERVFVPDLRFHGASEASPFDHPA